MIETFNLFLLLLFVIYIGCLKVYLHINVGTGLQSACFGVREISMEYFSFTTLDSTIKQLYPIMKNMIAKIF